MMFQIRISSFWRQNLPKINWKLTSKITYRNLRHFSKKIGHEIPQRRSQDAGTPWWIGGQDSFLRWLRGRAWSRLLTFLAKHPHTESSSCLKEARRLLLGSSNQAALVYLMVHEKIATRYARRALRDLSVWHCCGAVGFSNRDAFVAAIHTAFGHQLQKALTSQMLQVC